MKCDTCPADAIHMVGESNERLACASCAEAHRAMVISACAGAWQQGHAEACQYVPELCGRVHPNPYRDLLDQPGGNCSMGLHSRCLFATSGCPCGCHHGGGYFA